MGIKWLREHKALVNCKNKLIECCDDIGNSVISNGVKRPLELRHISAMQIKKARRKGCQLYVALVKDLEEDTLACLEDYVNLKEFSDVFPDDFLDLPPQREFNFSIDLVPRAEPHSRVPYRITSIEMYELNTQL